MSLVVFSNNAGTNLARSISSHLGMELGKLEIRDFANGEFLPRILENVRGKDAYVVGPTDNLRNSAELMYVARTLRTSGASRITVVPTILANNRQDKRDKPRTLLTGAAFIQELCTVSTADSALMIDMHSQALLGVFEVLGVVAEHLYASVVAAPYLLQTMPTPFVVASTDAGGFVRANAYAKLINADVVVFHKHRPNPNQVDRSSIRIIGDIARRHVLFVDDMADTLGTGFADSDAALEAGALSTTLFATHGIFSDNALAKLESSSLSKVIVTDTIPQDRNYSSKLEVISVAGLLARAIKEMHEFGSVSRLLSL